MKKFVTFLLLAFFVVGSLFSAQEKAKETAQVTLHIDEAKITGYRIGFTADVSTNGTWKDTSTDLNDIPNSCSSFDLEFDTANAYGHKEMYAYYKFKSFSTVNISFILEKPLVNDSVPEKTIDYKLEIKDSSGSSLATLDTSKISSSASVSHEASVDMSRSNTFAADYFDLVLTTAGVPANGSGSYSSEIVMQISGS